MTSTYRIQSPSFTALVVVISDHVFQSAPVLSWTVGEEWTYVRSQIQQRGWTIEPLVDDYHPQWLEWHGELYELKWTDTEPSTLMRISLHQDGEIIDLPFSKLPDKLKHLV